MTVGKRARGKFRENGAERPRSLFSGTVSWPAMALSRTSPAAKRAPVIMGRLQESYPQASVALKFSTPLEMLVATILSAQCTDERVNQVTESLFVKYRSPEDYLRVPESELAADIKPT